MEQIIENFLLWPPKILFFVFYWVMLFVVWALSCLAIVGLVFLIYHLIKMGCRELYIKMRRYSSN